MEAAWNLCGGNDDLYIAVDYSRSTTYVAVKQERRGGAGGDAGSGGGTSLAMPVGAYGTGSVVTWRASVDASGGSDLRIEARMASGVDPPAHLHALSLGECEVNLSSGSRCYVVADEESLRIDTCSGTHAFGIGPQQWPEPARESEPEPARPEAEPEPEPARLDPEPARLDPEPEPAAAGGAGPVAESPQPASGAGHGEAHSPVPGGEDELSGPAHYPLAAVAAAAVLALAAVIAVAAALLRRRGRGRTPAVPRPR